MLTPGEKSGLDPKDYFEMWENLGSQIARLNDHRADLEAQLSDVNKKIEHLQMTIRHLSPLALGEHLSEFDDIKELGFTGAVRSVLDRDVQLSAADIKTRMQERGFDFSQYSAPDASIRTILGRLVDANKAELIKEGNKRFYKFKFTDEEIPF